VAPQFLETSLLLQQKLDLPHPPPVLVNAIIKTKVPKFDRLLVPPKESAVRLLVREMAELKDLHGSHCRPNLAACAPYLGGLCWAYDWCHGSEETRRLRFNVKEEESYSR
jgi:hypothetical protein